MTEYAGPFRAAPDPNSTATNRKLNIYCPACATAEPRQIPFMQVRIFNGNSEGYAAVMQPRWAATSVRGGHDNSFRLYDAASGIERPFLPDGTTYACPVCGHSVVVQLPIDQD